MDLVLLTTTVPKRNVLLLLTQWSPRYMHNKHLETMNINRSNELPFQPIDAIFHTSGKRGVRDLDGSSTMIM
jgi:hypothetical protein